MSTVLVIDERTVDRHVLSRLARQADDEAVIHAFADPREAIAWATENTPDLVVTDYEMPGMDGADFTRQFRALPLCYDVPVIVVTIYEDRSFRYRALEAGATDFLLSPVDHQEFQARVRNLLRMRRQQKRIERRSRSLEHRLAEDGLVHQKALRETRETLRQVIDAVPAFVCATDREGRIIFANATVARRLAGSPDGVVGMRRTDILSPPDARRHTMIDRRIYDGLEERLTFEEQILGPDGTALTCLTVKSPLRDGDGSVAGVITVAIDISDRKEVERVAQRQKDHLRVVVDNIPDWIYATDEQHRFTLVNLAMARAFSSTPDRMIGRTLADHLDDPAVIERDRRGNAEVLGSGKAARIEEICIADVFGERQWLQTVKMPFVSSTGDIEVLSVTSDVSERRRAEEVLRQARDQAEAASRSKTDFLAALSHELRTPLNHIMGFAQVMAGEAYGPISDPRYRDYARNIHESGKHLLSILNDILDVSRLETGMLRLVEREVDVNRVVRSVARMIGERAGQAGLDLALALDETLPSIKADERMIRQMLLNLLSNATKFTPAGGGVRVSTGRNEFGSVLLSVADTGVGLAEADFEKALAPFGQIENPMSRNNHGSGLGLSLVKSMIELHGGRITLAGAPGEGTTVALMFPAARVIAGPTTAPAAVSVGEAPRHRVAEAAGGPGSGRAAE